MDNYKGSISIDPQFILDDVPPIIDYTHFEMQKHRKLFLNDTINDDVVETIICQIFKYNIEDDKLSIPEVVRKPIEIYINSSGGAVDIGLVLINIIENSKTPIHTIVLGRAYSMAGLIAISGHKRYCYRYSEYLIHDGSMITSNTTAKAKDQMEFFNKLDEEIKKLVISKTKIEESFYIENYRKELYMTADEAMTMGLVDIIVGK